MTSQQKPPELYLSLPHECSYLDGHEASSLFVDPGHAGLADYYDRLLQNGFRRSGRLIYRPRCTSCNECVSVRIPVNEFRPRRGQRRVKNRNRDILAMEIAPRFTEEHFALYRKYQRTRHTDGSMDNDDRNAYEDFLVNSPVNSRLMELRLDTKERNLVGVAAFDVVEDGLSAVYTFFDPDHAARAPGVFAILSQIELVQQMNRPYLYLGYWIRNCQKMSYKMDYQPLQGFKDGKWQDLTHPER